MSAVHWGHRILLNIVPSSVGSEQRGQEQMKYLVSAGTNKHQTLTIISQFLSFTKVKLSVCRAPHGVAVVDADVLSLLDVHRGPDHHPVVPVKVFAGVVDAGVLQDRDVGVQTLARCRGRGNLHQRWHFENQTMA